MAKPDRVTLISIQFDRTSWDGDVPPTHITYTMKKKTSVGLIEASATVDFLSFLTAGVESMDGGMFQTLGEQINREEMNRVLEMGATSDFGCDPRESVA